MILFGFCHPELITGKICNPLKAVALVQPGLKAVYNPEEQIFNPKEQEMLIFQAVNLNSEKDIKPDLDKA